MTNVTPIKPPKSKRSLDELVEAIMLDGNEYSPYELQEILKCEYNRFHSDGSITRSMRSLREKGYKLLWRYSHKNSRNTYYWLTK